ncbi:alpha/beta hydrolase family protein [Lonepinella sp. BR2474]|uniref:alpha/beta hydrolase family protein n=1 Tax=Lonepinella sp. BR2474 TaxID=3434548 RepID=UPI003F6DBBA0
MLKKNLLWLLLSSSLIGCSTQPPMVNQQVASQAINIHQLDSFSPQGYKSREIYPNVIVHALGEGENRVYIFLPDTPKNNQLFPVVFLHHGWLGMNPLNFGALTDHLARTGHIVIYPVYQFSEVTNPQHITQNAVKADRNALTFIQQQGYQLDQNRTLYIGFSMGAAITLNILAEPQHYGLPTPKGAVLMAPGDAYHVKHGEQGKSVFPNLKHIPKNLPVAIMSGSADTQIGVPTARLIAKGLCHLPNNKRVLLMLPNDSHAGRNVKSGHGSPGAPDSRYNFALTDHAFPKTIVGRPQFEASGSLNNLDFYGYWRVIMTLDNTLNQASPVLVGVGEKQVSLGYWPDGTAFAPMVSENYCQ